MEWMRNYIKCSRKLKENDYWERVVGFFILWEIPESIQNWICNPKIWGQGMHNIISLYIILSAYILFLLPNNFSTYGVCCIFFGSSLQHDLSVPTPSAKCFVLLIFPKTVHCHVTIPTRSPVIYSQGLGGSQHIYWYNLASWGFTHWHAFKRE